MGVGGGEEVGGGGGGERGERKGKKQQQLTHDLIDSLLPLLINSSLVYDFRLHSWWCFRDFQGLVLNKQDENSIENNNNCCVYIWGGRGVVPFLSIGLLVLLRFGCPLNAPLCYSFLGPLCVSSSPSSSHSYLS